MTFVPRNGLRLGEPTKQQRAAALDALAAVVSKEGYQKVIDIMNADDQLKGKDNKMKFGTENYYLAVFGKPSATKPWMVQFGGHHLGINVTIVGKETVLTPSHTGTQPDSFTPTARRSGPSDQRTTWHSSSSTCSMPNSRRKLCSAPNPRISCLGPVKTAKRLSRKDSSVQSQGRAASRAPGVDRRLGSHPAQGRCREPNGWLKAKIDESYFAWYGPTTNGSAAYYRIQGPKLWIEYAPQGGTNHIHTIIRDPSNDYGKELTKKG